jgi:hypothetical protein
MKANQLPHLKLPPSLISKLLLDSNNNLEMLIKELVKESKEIK